MIDRDLLTIDRTGADPTLRCDHPLIGEVLRAELPPARRRRLASELVPLLPADPDGGPAFLRRAHLHLESGAPVDADLTAMASVVARHAGDHRLAARLAEATLRVSDRNGHTGAAGAQAALTRAAIDAVELRPHAQDRFAEALEWAHTDEQRQLVMNEWAWGAMLGSGLDAARGVLDLVDQHMRSRAGHIAVQACRATFLGYSGRWHAAQKELGRLIEMLGSDGDGGRSAMCIRAMAAGFDGPAHDALSCARQARDIAASMSVLDSRTQQDVDDAVRLLRWRDPRALVSFAVASRGTTTAMAGDLDNARRFLDEYDYEFRAAETKTTTLADRGRAWLAYQEDDLDEAVMWADRAWAAAWEQTDCALWAAPAAHDLVRFGLPDRAIDRLNAAAARLQAPFSNALADHARALANTDVNALCVVSDTFARYGANALGAEALARASELSGAADRAELVERAVALLGDSLIRTPLLVKLLARTEPAGPIDYANPNELAPVQLGQEGAAWRITFDASSVLVRDLAGVRYLARLVANPNRPVRASKLAGGVDLPRSAPQPINDSVARRQIEERARDLAGRLVRAREEGRQIDMERLEGEVEQLTAELERSRQLNGGSRSFADPDERARTSVRKAIVRALNEIDSIFSPTRIRRLSSPAEFLCSRQYSTPSRSW